MRSIEVSARKREDAINKALSELGIERHEAHVEILDEGSPGFLGIGVRDVTVRVSTDVPGEGGFPIEADGNRIDFERRPAARTERGHGAPRDARRGPKRDQRGGDRDRGPRPQQQGRPGDRQNRDRRDRGPRRDQRPERAEQPAPPQAARPDRPAHRTDAPRKPDRPKSQRPDRPRNDRPRNDRPRDGRPRNDRPREERPRNDRPRDDRPRDDRPRDDRPRQERPRPEPKDRPPDKVLTDPRSCEAAALLNEIIQNMGIESSVQPLEAAQGGLKLSVQSPDSALLIGRKGRNLTAMQYLINRIFNRQDEWQQTERIVVDVEGYLDRRRDTLEDMALRLAERAKASGRRVRVKPLSPQERRIIHLALHDDPDVRTFSVGESNFRSVIIAPVTEGDADDDQDDRDEPEAYDADNGSFDLNGDDMLDDESDSDDDFRGRARPTRSKAPVNDAPAAAETGETSEARSDDTDEDDDEDDQDEEAGAEAGTRFRPRRKIGRRGAVRKRRPAKPLASVAADGERTGAGETKDDAPGDADNA